MATKRGTESEVLTRSESATAKPPLYRVLFHNDDYTTMEFVVSVLMTVFHHDEASAFDIMMNVHKNGIGVAGVYTREVAETRTAKAVALARKNDFPLEITIEPE